MGFGANSHNLHNLHNGHSQHNDSNRLSPYNDHTQ
jgi:hypothetical protein